VGVGSQVTLRGPPPPSCTATPPVQPVVDLGAGTDQLVAVATSRATCGCLPLPCPCLAPAVPLPCPCLALILQPRPVPRPPRPTSCASPLPPSLWPRGPPAALRAACRRGAPPPARQRGCPEWVCLASRGRDWDEGSRGGLQRFKDISRRSTLPQAHRAAPAPSCCPPPKLPLPTVAAMQALPPRPRGTSSGRSRWWPSAAIMTPCGWGPAWVMSAGASWPRTPRGRPT
jgi:hypothetical protein